jgi:hypothetical protein
MTHEPVTSEEILSADARYQHARRGYTYKGQPHVDMTPGAYPERTSWWIVAGALAAMVGFFILVSARGL